MNFQKIKDFIYNNIVYFAIYNVFFTLVIFLLFYADVDYKTMEIMQYFRIDFLRLSYFDTRLFELSRFGGSPPGFSEVFLPLFYVILLAAILLYFLSKKIEQRLLQFCISIMFLSNLIMLVGFSIVLGYLFVMMNETRFPRELGTTSYIISAIFQLLKLSFTVAVTGIYLRECKKRLEFERLPEETPDFVFLKDGKYQITLKRPSKGTRFLHYIVDSILIILIFSPILILFLRGLAREIEAAVGEELGLYLVLLVVGILYYLIYEGIFRMTPAKYLTSSAVTGYTSEKVNGIQILSRTFCRKIPFEAFSFFRRVASNC
ncbi:MAG: RDD family protein [Bacteroidota bacterium]